MRIRQFFKQPISVIENPDVRITATLASEGEILETKVDGQVVTTNIARAGDMKVSRTHEDSYYLGAIFICYIS